MKRNKINRKQLFCQVPRKILLCCTITSAISASVPYAVAAPQYGDSGRFIISSVGIDVPLYAGVSQCIVDAQDSAAYFEHNGCTVICDHATQANFDKLSCCQKNKTTAVIYNENGANLYECIATGEGSKSTLDIRDVKDYESIFSKYNGKLITYTCQYPFSYYVNGVDYEIWESITNPFVDVSNEALYAGNVAWAYKNGIAIGTSQDTFSPTDACTRSQIAAMLKRHYTATQEKPINDEEILALPFEDVEKDNWYYTAVVWAYQNSLTNGTSETTFSPDLNCTRAEIIAFLWNAEGRPHASRGELPATDISSSSWYYDAVRWAYEQGITVGTSSTTFSPDSVCTRAEVVSFLRSAWT